MCKTFNLWTVLVGKGTSILDGSIWYWTSEALMIGEVEFRSLSSTV